MLLSLLLRRRVRLLLRQAGLGLRLLRRWMVMLCRRRWCGGSLLMRSCILIRRCIGVRDINYRLQRRDFWSFSEILTKRKKETGIKPSLLIFCCYSFGVASSALAAAFGASASGAGASAFASASATGAAAISSSTTDCCTNCSFSSAVRI